MLSTGGCALALSPMQLFAMGSETRFTTTLLKWSPSGWDRRPNGMRKMLQEIEKRTSVEVRTGAPATPLDQSVFGHPMLFASGDTGFDPWSDETIDMMRAWFRAGGFLVVDSCEGVTDGPFLRSMRRELSRIFVDSKEGVVPKSHTLYKSFYRLDKPFGRVMASPDLTGYSIDDRLACVMSANDMLGAWSRDGFGRWEYDVVPDAKSRMTGERQRELSFRMGINLAMYALCVHYKSDQVPHPLDPRSTQVACRLRDHDRQEQRSADWHDHSGDMERLQRRGHPLVG